MTEEARAARARIVAARIALLLEDLARSGRSDCRLEIHIKRGLPLTWAIAYLRHGEAEWGALAASTVDNTALTSAD